MINFNHLRVAMAALLLLFGALHAQLTGIKTIPGDYATIAAAITDLNTVGVGAGGVTFNVAAGHTETAVNLVITATGTVGNPILFQKSGAGANPLITAGTGTSTTVDGIIKLSGTDFITFDGIDLQENAANTTSTTRMEWGYALVKSSATNGCQFVTIRNCAITLNRANTTSVGIYTGNHLPTSTTALTITATSGIHYRVNISANTISNVYTGISLKGAATTGFRDVRMEIGIPTGNTISNFSGGTTTAYGVYAINQDSIQVSNNNISNATSGSSHTTTLYGIFTSTGTNAIVDIVGNTINILAGGTTSSIYGISNAMGGTGTTNTVTISNNAVSGSYPTATSGAFYAIYNNASAYILNLFGNTVINCQLGSISSTGTGTYSGIYTFGSNTNAGSTWNINNNTVRKMNRTQSAPGAGSYYAIYNSSSGLTLNVYSNTVDSIGNPTSGTLGGIYISSTATTRNVYQNVIHALGSNTGTVYGIYLSSGTNSFAYRNKIYNLGSQSGTVNGIYTASGTQLNIYNNLIGDLNAPNSTANPAVNGMYFSGGTTINAVYNSIWLNASSTSITTFGTAGIYASTTPTLTLQNNIVVNSSTAGPTGGTTSAYRRSGTSLAKYQIASNSNILYAGTPSATNLLFTDGTNNLQTISAYKSFVAPRDAGSYQENVPFLSTSGASAQFLHVDGTVPSRVESNATIVALTTDDYDLPLVRTGYPLAGQVNGGGFGPDIGADEGDFKPMMKDVTAVALLSPVSGICGDSTTLITMVVRNVGVENQDSIPVGVTWAGAGSGAQSDTLITNIGFTQQDTLTFAVPLNTYAGGSFTFKIFTLLTGDIDLSNDTLTVTVNIYPTPTLTLNDTAICGSGTVTLTAISPGNVTWFDAPVGGAVLGTGAVYTTPVIFSSTTYYAEAVGEINNSLTTTFTDNNGCQGAFFDLQPVSDMSIDSFDINVGVTTAVTVLIYYRNGTYAGNEASSAGWTLLDSVIVTGAGTGLPTRVVTAPLSVTGGLTYGMYVRLTTTNLRYTNITGITNYSNADLLISTGTGSCSAFGGLNANRSFNGTVYYTRSGCPTGRKPVTVTVNALPTVSLGADTAACGSFVLDALNPGATYLWNTGDTTQTLTVATTGTYYVDVTNTFGCTSRDSVVVTINPIPVVSLGADTNFCEGSSLLLDAGNPSASYLWNTGDTTQVISVTLPGTYFVDVTNVNGCSFRDSIILGWDSLPVADFSWTVISGGNVSFTDASSYATTWAWDFGDAGSDNVPNPTHTYATSGSYIVTLIVSNACGADTLTDTVSVTVVGTDKELLDGVRIYPNPVLEGFSIDAGTLSGDVQVSLTSLLGNKLDSWIQLQGTESWIPMTGYASGVYFLELRSGSLIKLIKLVKE